MLGFLFILIILFLYFTIRLMILRSKPVNLKYDPDITKINYCKLHKWHYSTDIKNYICTTCGFISGNFPEDDNYDDSY